MSDGGPMSGEPMSDVRVIWKKGDGPMPEKAQHVVDAARGELSLETLRLPGVNADAVGTIGVHYITITPR